MSSPTSATPVMLVLGMAGSGKTSFVNALSHHLTTTKQPAYVVNIDPAVLKLPYEPNIDIRTTINYKEVMRHYKLGPNGAIITSLNLFSIKFNEVIRMLEAKDKKYSCTVVDTPGQIEVFTWSASGMIISETLATLFPTFIVYLIDTPRNLNPCTFMSNMLYALSVMYKMRLPLIVVFTKTDLADCSDILTWMTDFEAMEEALQKHSSYSSSLATSMCLALEEFYKELKCVKVSSVTLDGFYDFVQLFASMVSEYKRESLHPVATPTPKPETTKPKTLDAFCGKGDEISFFPNVEDHIR